MEDISMAEVFQLINVTRKTGILTVVGQGNTARVFFLNGRVVHAEDFTGQGEEVIMHLFGVPAGQFHFEQRAFEAPHTVTTDTLVLIMRAAKRLDERAAQREGGEATPTSRATPSALELAEGRLPDYLQFEAAKDAERRSFMRKPEGQESAHPVLRLNLAQVNRIIQKLEAL